MRNKDFYHTGFTMEFLSRGIYYQDLLSPSLFSRLIAIRSLDGQWLMESGEGWENGRVKETEFSRKTQFQGSW